MVAGACCLPAPGPGPAQELSYPPHGLQFPFLARKGCACWRQKGGSVCRAPGTRRPQQIQLYYPLVHLGS